MCGGDGKETCSNPDHGFIHGIGGEISRLGCPCCGHDENFKVFNGGDCQVCNGSGSVSQIEFDDFCKDYPLYDNEPILKP